MLVFQETGLGSQRWKRFSNDKVGFSVEIYAPTTDEFAEFASKYRLGQRDADLPGMRRFVAKNWTRSFTGLQKPDGTAHDDTPEIRALVFNEFTDVWSWILERIQDFSAWRDEGNAGSGSAS
jgi:hypothetical protein